MKRKVNIPTRKSVTKHVFEALRFFIVLVSTLAVGLALNACGAGSSSDNNGQDDGEVIIGLTDAPGDFQTYTVDVVSLSLEKANGEIVETLPVQTTVDFSQYTEMTEFLTAATVPSGVYVRASMVLDYTKADIQVENEAGDTVVVNSILDEDGNDISIMELRVRLEDRNQLKIAPGIPANLTLDFDLKASNDVSFGATGEAIVTVEPFLIADVNLERNKIHRLRGLLNDVNIADSYYDVTVRPFYHAINEQDDRFGTIRVTTTEKTVYEIDQVVYEGVGGLEALDTLPALASTVAVGEIRLNPRRFVATQVYAGSSVPGGDKDVVHGNVIARVDDTLTVKGATLIRANGSAIFRDVVTVQLADTTSVHRQHSMVAHTIDDVSVGQRVRVFGQLTNDDPAFLEMDASEGHVGMLITTLNGNAIRLVSIPEDPAPFMLDLQSIDHRVVDIFDFSGTGDVVENDADPAAYEIETGPLDLSSIMDGAPVKVRGFVAPFRQAPFDFEARTITDVSAVRGNLGVSWNPPTETPLIDLSSSGMLLNLEGQGKFHHLSRSGVKIDLNTLDSLPFIHPGTSGEGQFLIFNGEVIQLFTTFSAFVKELESLMFAGGVVKSVRASGTFYDAGSTMTTSMIRIRFL